jgi:hypothetical protein
MFAPDWPGRPITPTMVFEVHRLLSALIGWGIERDRIDAKHDPRRHVATPETPVPKGGLGGVGDRSDGAPIVRSADGVRPTSDDDGGR